MQLFMFVQYYSCPCVEIPHSNVWENNIPLCGNPSQDSVEIPHRNIIKDYNNSILDNYANANCLAVAANERTNEQASNNQSE